MAKSTYYVRIQVENAVEEYIWRISRQKAEFFLRWSTKYADLAILTVPWHSHAGIPTRREQKGRSTSGLIPNYPPKLIPNYPQADPKLTPNYPPQADPKLILNQP